MKQRETLFRGHFVVIFAQMDPNSSFFENQTLSLFLLHSPRLEILLWKVRKFCVTDRRSNTKDRDCIEEEYFWWKVLWCYAISTGSQFCQLANVPTRPIPYSFRKKIMYESLSNMNA